jgi:hypothetical protein
MKWMRLSRFDLNGLMDSLECTVQYSNYDPRQAPARTSTLTRKHSETLALSAQYRTLPLPLVPCLASYMFHPYLRPPLFF